MKEVIAVLLKKYTPLSVEQILSLIEIPPTIGMGDYAFPCFILVKEMQKSPNLIALQLAERITLPEEIDKAEAHGPYLNFFVNKKILAEKILGEILAKNDKYGKQNISHDKVMVEFSQANTHKAFHVGHVRGTSLGESIARIMKFLGNKVIRANYQGDTGMHVAKWIWCYKKFHFQEKLRKDEAWIASVYVDAVKKLEENKEYETEVEEVNRKLESRKNKELSMLWRKTRKLSLDSFEEIYKELDTKFDVYFFESEEERRGKEIALELIEKGIAKISDGAVIIDFQNYNLGVWVLLRKDKTVLYSAKDLALAEKKFSKYKIDKAIYVVGSAQRLHFMQLFKSLELMKFKQSINCIYIPVSEVRFPWGKMSSRTGENVLYTDFKTEIIDKAKEEIIKHGKGIEKKLLNNRALTIAMAAIKYSMLKQDLNKVFIFNKDEEMRFEGNTGPYLLYTYARASSILRKTKEKNLAISANKIDEKEVQLIKKLGEFPSVVVSAYNALAPAVIANYAYHIAQAFNEFYHSCPVIGSESESFRLSLVKAFTIVMKSSLYLLGIKAIERM